MRTAIVAAWAVLGVGAAAGQEAVVIKVRKPTAGATVEQVETDESTQTTTVTVQGRAQVQEEKKTSRVVYTDEVLEAADADPKPTKLRRAFKTVEVSQDGKKEDVGLDGKTVVATKKGTKYEFAFADGGTPDGAAAKFLARTLKLTKDMDDDLFPATPVRPGGTWKIDMAKVAKALDDGLTIDKDASTGTGKLTKVYTKNGHKFGVLTITLDLAVAKVGGGKDVVALKPGSKMKFEMSGDGCIDGKESTGTMKMSMSADFTGNIPGAELGIKMTAAGTKTSTEVGKKK